MNQMQNQQMMGMGAQPMMNQAFPSLGQQNFDQNNQMQMQMQMANMAMMGAQQMPG